jgi:hypothetical protein
MEMIKKEYVKTTKRNTFIKVELLYNLGGYNIYTGESDPRGYYISAYPVERVDKYSYALENYTAGTIIKKCIVPVNRKSKKQESIALELFDIKKQNLIEIVLLEYNLKAEA